MPVRVHQARFVDDGFEERADVLLDANRDNRRPWDPVPHRGGDMVCVREDDHSACEGLDGRGAEASNRAVELVDVDVVLFASFPYLIKRSVEQREFDIAFAGRGYDRLGPFDRAVARRVTDPQPVLVDRRKLVEHDILRV